MTQDVEMKETVAPSNSATSASLSTLQPSVPVKIVERKLLCRAWFCSQLTVCSATAVIRVPLSSGRGYQSYNSMMIASSFAANSLALLPLSCTKLPFHLNAQRKFREFKDGQFDKQASSMIYKRKITISTVQRAYTGKNNFLVGADGGLPQDPFLNVVKEIVWNLRSLVVFLLEQPSQLRYIEWPRFQITLRTAALTLILVAALIVALSSVDSVLCYLLAVLLRRSS